MHEDDIKMTNNSSENDYSDLDSQGNPKKRR